MAVVLTLVQTKQIIYINETIQNSVETIQNRVETIQNRVETIQNTINTSTHYTKIPTRNKTNTYTHTHILQNKLKQS